MAKARAKRSGYRRSPTTTRKRTSGYGQLVEKRSLIGWLIAAAVVFVVIVIFFSRQIILDARGEDGKGILLTTTDLGTLQIRLNDGRTESAWDCDQHILKSGVWHHIAVIVDGGPKIITFLVDGVLCDGGEIRQFGWGRFNRDLGDINGAKYVQIAPTLSGRLAVLRIYDRYLRVSEIVGNFRKGRG